MPGVEKPPAGGPTHDRPTATGLHVHADFAPGTVLAGRFRIEKLLGVGGMGVVYRATDLTLDVPVALKLLRPELASRHDAFERFRQELLLARQVSSPHVVRIHDLVRHEGLWLIGMDFVDGESLDRRMDREGAFPVEDALQVARQLAEGLAAAHAKGVVHRDLKPANVLLDADGNAYISDFGVARSLATSGMTRSGAVVGTPDYLSPEQARGDAVDARSDLYALGLILYEMLAGSQPFPAATVSEALAQRMLRTPRPVGELRADVPPWVSRLVDRLLRPQPAHRFEDARAVVSAIDRREVPADPWSMRARRALRGGRGIVAALGLLVVLGAGGWLWQRQAQDASAGAPSPPLQRLLVMPLAADGDAPVPRERLVALGARLHDALALTPGLATVDRARALQTLQQVDPAGGGSPTPASLRAVAAADRVLQPRLGRRAGGWQVVASLDGPAGAARSLEGPAAADPAAAVQAWLQAPRTASGLGTDPGTTGPFQPVADTALDAQGAGLAAQAAGDLAGALQAFQRAGEVAPDDPAIALSLAETALAIGEQDIAFEALDRGRDALAADAPPRLRQRFDAELALLEGEPARAVAAWRATLEDTPDDTFAELNLARAQGAGGDFGAAVTGLERLTARDGNDPRAWYELGKFSILAGDARRAVDDYLLRALVLFKRSGNRYGEAETLNALGIGYGRLGQTADAMEQYRDAAEMRRAVGNRAGVATSLRNLANLEALTGRFDAAAANLAEARQAYADLGDRNGLAAVDNELGLLAEEQGDYRAALEAFRRALAGWREVDDAHGIAQALNNIGFADYQLGAYDDAQVYWQQAAEAYGTLGSATGRIRTQQNLGLLATARGRWPEARRLLEGSLADAQAQQMVEEAAVSHRNLAELALWEGRLGEAITQAQRAEALFLQREDRRGQSDAGLLRVQALLEAHADAPAAELLHALQPLLAESSAEQRAIARLQEAALAVRAGRGRDASAALGEAARLAAASGVGALQLQIGVEGARLGIAPPPADLGDAIGRLGHAGLRLAWLEWRMQERLAAGRPEAALQAWSEAGGVPRGRDYVHAHRLHALHARALAATGDAPGAAEAGARAARARDGLAEGLPEPLRTGFDDATRPMLADVSPTP